MVWSHHRRGWGPCSAFKAMVYNKNPCVEASFVCPTSIQALGVDFKPHTGPQWPWYEATIIEAGDLVQLFWAMVYNKNPCFQTSFFCPTSRFKRWTPVAMVWRHHRRGWGPCTAMVNDKNPRIKASFVCSTSIHTHSAPVAMVWRHHRRGWGPCTAAIGNCLWQKPTYLG